MTVNYFFIGKLTAFIVALFTVAMIFASKGYFNQQERSPSVNLFLSLIKIEKQFCCGAIKNHVNSLVADAYQQHKFPVDKMQKVMAHYKEAYCESRILMTYSFQKMFFTNWQS